MLSRVFANLLIRWAYVPLQATPETWTWGFGPRGLLGSFLHVLRTVFHMHIFHIDLGHGGLLTIKPRTWDASHGTPPTLHRLEPYWHIDLVVYHGGFERFLRGRIVEAS